MEKQSRLTDQLARLRHKVQDMDLEISRMERLVRQELRRDSYRQTEESISFFNLDNLVVPKSAIPSPTIELSTPVVSVQAESNRVASSKTVEKSPPKIKARNLEKFVGENLVNKVGIGILVLGISLFVKYAIDQNWIGIWGRMMVGLASGALLLGIGHRLKDKYRSFSSILAGGGIAIFYTTIAIGFHLYELFDHSIAFGAMVAISGLAVFLALLYDQQELGILALLGALATPFLAFTGNGEASNLFFYLAIVNTSMLYLAYRKNWSTLDGVTFTGTSLLFGSIITAEYVSTPTYKSLPGVWWFFAVYYFLTFFGLQAFNTIKAKPIGRWETFRNLSNGMFFFLMSNFILSNKAMMFVCGGMVLLYGGMAWLAQFRFNQKRKTINIWLALSAGALTILPVYHGLDYHLTYYWAIEAVALILWAWYSQNRILQLASAITSMAMLTNLWNTWNKVYSYQGDVSIVFNAAFLTGIATLGSLFAVRYILRKSKKTALLPADQNHILRNVYATFTTLTLYLIFLLELNYHLEVSFTTPERAMVLTSFHLIFLLVGMLLARRKQVKSLVRGTTLLGMLLMGSYLVIHQLSHIPVRNAFIISKLSSLSTFLYHYINTGLYTLLGWLSLQNIRKEYGLRSPIGKASLWGLSFCGVVMLSGELDHLALWLLHDSSWETAAIMDFTHRTVYPIAWGLLSFCLIWLGFKKKLRTLRVIALSLFTLTLVKLFMVDLTHLSEGGKIVAFICLGVLLLIVSFLYQKLKNWLFEEDLDQSASDAS